jgi:hypothetical protein
MLGGVSLGIYDKSSSLEISLGDVVIDITDANLAAGSTSRLTLRG